MRITMIGPFGMSMKGTMHARALPLARALVGRGHGVDILLPPWDSPADDGRSWSDEGVRIRSLSLRGVMFPRSSPLLALRLIRAASSGKPDVLHLFKPIGYAGVAGMVARHWPGGPAVVFDLDDLEGRCGWADAASLSALEAWLRDRQERWALRYADGLTVASHALRDLALRAGMPGEWVHLVLNGCEKAGSAPISEAYDVRKAQVRARHNIEVQGRVLLWPTRFSEVGLARAAALLRRVASERPDVRILVAGSGLSGEEARWAELVAADDTLRGTVRNLGWLGPAAWREAVLAADVGIMPLDDTPVNRARCPAKIPQLMAWGLPLVVDRVGEAGTYIVDGSTGRLIEPGDDDGFVAAALEMVDQPQQAARYASEASRRAERWTWQAQASMVEKAYGAVLAARPRATTARRR